MKNFYGPYYSVTQEDLWHWKRECPDFPPPHCVIRISTTKLEEEKLCSKCLVLDGATPPGMGTRILLL